MSTSSANFFRLTLLLSAIALPGYSHAADSASGYFRFGEHETQVAHVCAYRVADDAKPGERYTQLFMTATAVDCAAAMRGFDVYSALRDAAIEARTSFVMLNIGATDSPDGEFSTPEVDGGYPFSFGSPDTKPQTTLNDPGRVEGSWRNATPQEFFDKAYAFEIRFAVDVVDPDADAKPLGANGGEAGKALQDFIAAVARKDTAVLRKSVATARRDEFLQTLEFVHGMMPAKATVGGGLQKSELAALDIEATSHDGNTLLGRILMQREDGEWKYLDSRLRVVF